MKIVSVLMSVCALLFSFSLLAQYNQEQRADAEQVFAKLKQLDGLDTELVLPLFEQEYQNALNDQARLDAVYKIITLSSPAAQQEPYHQELKHLAVKLGQKEFEQIAKLYLALDNVNFSNGDSLATLASWREQMPKNLTNRVNAHYLFQLSRIDRSQTVIQQLMQHYLALELNDELPQERFLLLKSVGRYDQVLEQKRAATKRAFDYAMRYQYPVNRLTYLYNQVILLVDNAEYDLAQEHAEFYLTLASKLDNKAELFFANQVKGYVLIFQQDYDKALTFINNAERYAQQVNIRWQMQNKRFATRAWLLLGKLEQARVSHKQDQEYLQLKPELDKRELHFHNLNQSYMALLEGKTLEGIAMIEAIFYRSYADIIAERNNNISKIREIANRELDAKVRANTNLTYLIATLSVLALLFVAICLSLARQIKLRKALQKSRDHAIKIGRTDGLTQLNNRQYFHDCLEREFSRLKRYQNSAASLLILDIDRFKSVNDIYGHQAGDRALATIGKLIQQRTRNTDISGRLGGEEFVILLTETAEQGASIFAESFREAVAKCEIAHQQQLIELTTSIGIAAYTTELDAPADWLERADKALYKAKNEGRNRVIVYQ